MVLMQPFINLFSKFFRERFHLSGFLLRNSACSFIPPNVSFFPEFVELEISCGLVLCSTNQPLSRQFVKLIFVTYYKYLGRIQHGFNKMLFFR
jgi:hypothetical protein